VAETEGLQWIRVRGARQHNLKNIAVDIPRNRLVVITGVSGSGKSSLAFDTIYAEGQRRYVESLSAYARQFLGQMEKPDVDQIEGLSPAISIDQKTTSHNPRSTVGTVTEIYDYLRLLYARVGIPHCPTCGVPISQQTVDQVVERVLARPPESRIEVRAPLVRGRKGTHERVLADVRAMGYSRVRVDGALRLVEEPIALDKNKKHTIAVVVDRLVLREGVRARLAEAIETAMGLSGGVVEVAGEQEVDGEWYSRDLACPHCGFSLAELSPRLFSFNAPYGACPACTGLGQRLELDPELVVPDPRLSIREGAVAPFFRSSSRFYQELLEAVAEVAGIPLDVPFQALTPEQQQIVLYGYPDPVPFHLATGFGHRHRHQIRYQGALPILDRRYREGGDAGRAEVEEYMTAHPCPQCHGLRLKPEVLAVKVGGLSIADFTAMSIRQARRFVADLRFEATQSLIAAPILKEVGERLGFLEDVGLGYLTLDRAAESLSGGEAQRIRLATQIGSSLVGVLYILDEPSIGLHQRDNDRLIQTLKRLRDLGNTVLVVEHDEDTMRASDYIVDIGPGPGVYGGEVVAAGPPAAVMENPRSLTGRFL
jgi:excinuclease ABC subunit A